MDLIDRYLSAVSFLLPRAQREDIIAELRDALVTRREEQEAQFGRPIAREEEAALLRAFGHPLDVAARYGRQQYLVGPELYPLYVFALKLVVAIVTVSALITAVVVMAVRQGDLGFVLTTALQTIGGGVVSSVGVLTIAAAVMQWRNIRPKFLYDWNPQDLPAAPTPPRFRRQTAFDHAAGIVVTVFLALWWAHVIPLPLPYVPLKSGHNLNVAMAPVWAVLFWPVLGLAAGAIVLHGLRLAGKAYERTADIFGVAFHLAGLIVVCVALRAGDWVEISAAGLPSAALGQVHLGVNTGIEIALIVSAISWTCQAAYGAWRLYRGARAR